LLQNTKFRLVNQQDPTNGDRTPIHVCHMSANFSTMKRQWVTNDVYSQFERQLLANRMVFERIQLLTLARKGMLQDHCEHEREEQKATSSSEGKRRKDSI
jgi:hypothetical protein